MSDSTVENRTQSPANGGKAAPVRRWHGLADGWLKFPLGRFLEYGCGPCTLTMRVADRCDECHGVDVDAERTEAARQANPGFVLSTVGLDGRTDYPDNHFDTVVLIEVIEHVPDESTTLAEIERILKPGGRLLITTPHRGLLTFLDPGNFKFVFPRLHRFVHVYIRRQRSYYDHRFGQAEKRGLIGDISRSAKRRPWHRHYYPREIIDACSKELTCERYAVYFPAMRAMMLLRVILNVCSGGLIQQLFPPFSWLERRLSLLETPTGDQLVMLFRKSGRG